MTFRDNVLFVNISHSLDHGLTYDALGRVATHTSGHLLTSGSQWMFNPLAPNNTTQSYSYDVQGNRDDAGGFLDSLLNMVSYTPGASPGAQTMVYDLWGRLVSTGDSATGSTTGYGYDALGRLVRSAAVLKVYDEEEDEDDETPSNDLLSSTVRWMTYDASGRVIYEEIEAANTGPNVGFGSIYQQRQVWSPTTGGLVFRERDTNTASAGYEERLYAMYDGAGNVTAITDVYGRVQERYAVDPFGGNARVFYDGPPVLASMIEPGDPPSSHPAAGNGNAADLMGKFTLGTDYGWDELIAGFGKTNWITDLYQGPGGGPGRWHQCPAMAGPR